MLDSKKILEKSKQSLLALAEQLNTVTMEAFQEFELKSSQFRTLDSLKTATTFLSKNDTPIVYIIELTDIEKRNNLLQVFKSFRQTNKTKEKSKTRLNQSRDNNRDAATLYVGSSTGNFHSRLKDHLGLKTSHRTYALHLSKWDNNLEYTIRIKTYKIVFPTEPERAIVEIIEQQIWDQLQPVFGKRSGLL